MTAGSPAYACTTRAESCWLFRNGDNWSKASGNFVEGKTYAFQFYIYVDNNTAYGSPSSTAGTDYVLDIDNLVVTINGEPTDLGYVFANDTSSYVMVYSQEIYCGREFITTIDAYSEDKPREIHIYYKYLDEPLKDKRILYSTGN